MDTLGWSPFNPSRCLPYANAKQSKAKQSNAKQKKAKAFIYEKQKNLCLVKAEDLLHVREGQFGGGKQQRLVC